jgi:hypothetical protein
MSQANTLEGRRGTKRLTVSQLSEEIGYVPKTIRKWARIGRIPGRKEPGGWRFDLALVEKCLNATCGNATEREMMRKA